jgi:hypothetical protein
VEVLDDFRIMADASVSSRKLQRALVAVSLVLCASPRAIWSQNDEPQDSVAAAARRTRAERSATGHVSAKKVLDEGNTPRSSLVPRSQEYYATIPNSKLTLFLPTSNRAAEHGVEIPLEKSNVYVPFAETTWTPDLNYAAHQFFEMILTRSRFNGVTLKMGLTEESTVSGQSAVLVHFSFMFRGVGHDGLAMFITVPEQVVGFGCVYRTVDWEKAQPICEQIVNLAEVSVPSEYRVFKKPFH